MSSIIDANVTTLIVALIPRLRARGFTVSTLKHAHHDVDLDTPGKDTWRHREAGAAEVLVSSSQRWALMRELRGGAAATRANTARPRGAPAAWAGLMRWPRATAAWCRARPSAC